MMENRFKFCVHYKGHIINDRILFFVFHLEVERNTKKNAKLYILRGMLPN